MVFHNRSSDFLLSFYRLLQSPVFELSDADALYWLERCLCQEHAGFHLNLNYHERLLADLRRHFEPMDYLWPINREVRVMAAGNSIEQALEENAKAFEQFSQSLEKA